MQLAQRNAGAFRQAQSDIRDGNYSPTALISDVFFYWLNTAEAMWIPYEHPGDSLDLLVREGVSSVMGDLDPLVPMINPPDRTALVNDDATVTIPLENIIVSIVNGAIRYQVNTVLPPNDDPAPAGIYTGRLTDGPANNAGSPTIALVTLVIVA
jgi:hypothetical protein